jgi:F-type H+-transporting ATPase subunit b
MTRRSAWLMLVAVILLAASAQGLLAQQIMTPQEKAALDVVNRWKVVNTAIFVILLGYALGKYAPRFFNARSADIQKAIQDATGLKIEADFRYSEIDRKMATLAEEVKRLRDQAAVEMEREHQRLRHETQVEIDHIHHNVQAETEAFRSEGILRVRQHAAQLAFQSAERRLQERFASGEPDGLFRDFIHLVEQSKN